jgi:cell division protein FtsB
MDKRHRWWYLIVLGVVIGLTLVYAERRNLLGRYTQDRQMEQQVRAADQTRDALRNEIDVTRQHVKDLRDDPAEIEAAVRHSKGLVRKDEKIYRIEKAPETKTP